MRYLVVALALGLVIGPAQPVSAQQIRSGVLTCDVSAGMGLTRRVRRKRTCIADVESVRAHDRR